MVEQKKEQKDFSVIIPAYNAGLLIGRCLDSIISQATNYDIEVLIIDDGSTDDTCSIIENRTESNIRLIHQQNSGPAAARNKGIEMASGKYIAFLDADDYWLPGFIDKTIEFMNTNNCVAVSVAQRHITKTKDYLLPSFVSSRSNIKPFIINDFFTFWAKNNHICTGSVVMLTSAVKDAGGQLVDLYLCEDMEFWAYLSTFGKFGFIPEVLFVSDGNRITKNVGWKKKNIIRWSNAPAISQWERRIVAKLSNRLPNGYIKARGCIALNTIICMILAKKNKIALNETILYREDFPNSMISKILQLCSKNFCTWRVCCFVIRAYNNYLNYK